MSSKLQSLEKLETIIADTFGQYAAADGEAFADGYKKYPKLWRSLTRSDMALEKALSSYYTKLAKKLVETANWLEYERRAQKVRAASILDNFITVKWTDEKLLVKVLLVKALKDAIEAGGNFTELEQNIDVGWSADNQYAQQFLTSYAIKLSGNLNKTTTDLVKSSIGMSIELGESQSEATARLRKTIANPRRAATIAHTEAVRAFAGGSLSVAAQIGVDRKQWDATIGACPICAPLDGKIVALDKQFAPGIFAEPAHPNCRCLTRFLMPENGKPADYDPQDITDAYIDQY